MSWKAPKLRHRIQIRKALPLNNVFGGFDVSYETLLTIWAEIKDKSGSANYIKEIRGVNSDVAEVADTIFTIRYESVRYLGRAFSSAYSEDYDSIEDINPVKSDYFIFLQIGNNVNRGRSYKILGTKRDDDRKEWLEIRCMEVEEKGTGATE